MKSMVLCSYRIDSSQGVVFCDDKPMDCVETARKATAVSRQTFSIFQWLYFHAVDLLAHLFSAFKKRQFTETRVLAGNLIADQQKFVKLRTKVSGFVKNHFKVISTNVKHLDEADVICLGETHRTYHHMFNNGKLIDTLSEPGDLILVEHDESLPTFRSDQAKYVKRPLTIKGWDKLDGEIQEISSKLDLDPMNLRRLSAEKLEEMRSATQKVIDGVPERNRHMCQTIEENRGKERRIYVIAGSGHLSLPKGKMYRGLNAAPQEEAFQETLRYLKKTKYAILIPK